MKIYQIEVSNLCNLTCGYCPHPRQHRPKGLMSEEIFEKSIELLIRCGQKKAFLHNFGEPLLHPGLSCFIEKAIRRGVVCSFFTNGMLLEKDSISRLVMAGLGEICVSGHVPGEIERIQELIANEGLPIKITDVFRPTKEGNHSWAGQVLRQKVAFTNIQPESLLPPCVFERENAVVVLWDGRINTCCIESEGEGVLGTVDDFLLNGLDYTFQPVRLCSTCTLMRGEEVLE